MQANVINRRERSKRRWKKAWIWPRHSIKVVVIARSHAIECRILKWGEFIHYFIKKNYKNPVKLPRVKDIARSGSCHRRIELLTWHNYTESSQSKWREQMFQLWEVLNIYFIIINNLKLTFPEQTLEPQNNFVNFC